MSATMNGDLRVWWVPQVPMKAFTFPVANLVEAKVLLTALAQYDLFQLENNVKPDYANAGGLSAYFAADREWLDWYDGDGRNIDDIDLEELRRGEVVWDMAGI